MESVASDIPQLSQASAFSNGKDQVINNASVLNATRDIIIYGMPQLNPTKTTPRPSIMSRIRTVTVSLFQDASKRGLPQIEQVSDKDVKFNDDDGDESMKGYESDSDETCVNIMPSCNNTVIRMEALNKAPSSCRSYTEQMLPHGYGYPLYHPQPDGYLPVEYRRKGVSIGDVGIITPDGGFDFLFNIWLPAQHPIHPDDLPDDFDSIPRPKQKKSFRHMFNAGGVVSNMDIESNIDSNTRDIWYKCKNGDKGAILSLPQGASQESLKNESELKEFISKNVLNWYRYALLSCGPDMDRHSLYLVTRCTKSKSWGIATFDMESREPHSSLVIGGSNNRDDPSYIWKKSGGATSFRSGPSPDPDSCNENSMESGIPNQTLFLRCFKMSLSEETWNSMRRNPVDVMITEKDGEGPFLPERSFGHNSSSESRDTGNGSGMQPSPFTNLRHDISISSFLANNKAPFHPLNALNDMLLSQIPGARVAITHDNLWCEMVEQNGDYDTGNEAKKYHYIVDYCEETRTCTLREHSPTDQSAPDEPGPIDISYQNGRNLSFEYADSETPRISHSILDESEMETTQISDSAVQAIQGLLDLSLDIDEPTVTTLTMPVVQDLHISNDLNEFKQPTVFTEPDEGGSIYTEDLGATSKVPSVTFTLVETSPQPHVTGPTGILTPPRSPTAPNSSGPVGLIPRLSRPNPLSPLPISSSTMPLKANPVVLHPPSLIPPERRTHTYSVGKMTRTRVKSAAENRNIRTRPSSLLSPFSRGPLVEPPTPVTSPSPSTHSMPTLSRIPPSSTHAYSVGKMTQIGLKPTVDNRNIRTQPSVLSSPFPRGPLVEPSTPITSLSPSTPSAPILSRISPNSAHAYRAGKTTEMGVKPTAENGSIRTRPSLHISSFPREPLVEPPTPVSSPSPSTPSFSILPKRTPFGTPIVEDD